MKRELTLINNDTKQVVETTLDALDLETIIGLKELTKDILRAMLEEENIILTDNAFKKVKRLELIEMLYTLMHPEMPNETINNNTVQEGTTMATITLEELVKQVTDNQKTSDAGYIKKDDLKEIMNKQFDMNFNNRTTRDHMVEVLMAMYKDSLRIADEVSYGNIPNPLATEAEVKPTSVAQTSYDSAVIRSIIATCCMTQWNNNTQKAKNYISAFILESCINRVLHGQWSKDFTTRKDNVFTAEQVAATQDMKKHLLAGPYFIPYKEKGYIINAEYLAWFYETQLHAHLVYRFTFEDKSKGVVDYRIDRANKVVVNLKTNETSPIDWNKINNTLNFNRVEINK